MGDADKLDAVFSVARSLFEENKMFFNEMMSFIPYGDMKEIGEFITLYHFDTPSGGQLDITEMSADENGDEIIHEFTIHQKKNGAFVIDENDYLNTMWTSFDGLREDTTFENLQQIYEFFRILDEIKKEWKR